MAACCNSAGWATATPMLIPIINAGRTTTKPGGRQGPVSSTRKAAELHCSQQDHPFQKPYLGSSHMERERAHRNITFCSSEGRVDTGTTCQLTGQQQSIYVLLRQFFRWLTSWLPQGQQPFHKAYVLKVYVPLLAQASKRTATILSQLVVMVVMLSG